MIDVSHKFNTLRYARAQGILRTDAEIVQRIKEKQIPKGDVLEVGRAAGIQAAKRASDWIVFCHPMPLDWVGIHFEIGTDSIVVFCEVKSVWKTGVEMEAMAGVSAVLLNMYDMLKPLTDNLSLGDMKLEEKKGGKSDFQDTLPRPLRTAILVISDSTFAGQREDTSGKAMQEYLAEKKIGVDYFGVLPDNVEQIRDKLINLIDQQNMDLIFTTGGTGLGPKDLTPEAVRQVIYKEIPGITEAIRKHGKERTPRAMLSREIAGLRRKSIIVTLPGSKRGSVESLQALFPGLLHAFPMLWGEGHH